jgi:hypothetical protein
MSSPAAIKFSSAKGGLGRKHYLQIVIGLVVFDAALFVAAFMIFLRGWSS